MKVKDMTREDFESVPRRSNFMSYVKPFKSLVLIPTDVEHDSGYLCMDFVSVDNHDEPIERLSGCSDVLHINGIGGYGDWRSTSIPKMIPPVPWSIDCLPKSGYLRLFCGQVLTCGDALSSFEVFANNGKKGGEHD